MWAKEVNFLVSPPISVEFQLKFLEFVLEFCVQRCQFSFLIDFDFVGVAHGFWDRVCGIHLAGVIRITEVAA